MSLALIPLACSSCFFGDDVRWAYYATAILMIALPFVLIGGSIRWLRRGDRAHFTAAGRTSRIKPMRLALIAAPALVGLVVALESAGLGSAPPGRLRGGPPVLAELPEFTLLDQRAEPFGSAQLAGHVWVGNFVFTRCPTVCPVLTRQMALVQDRTASTPDVRLVSFTIDPDHDTAEVLGRYAQRHGADAERWRFLTGPLRLIKSAVADGFRVQMGDAAGNPDAGSVFHGTRSVLVDRDARIRGYYDIETEAGVALLLRDVELLAQPDADADSAH